MNKELFKNKICFVTGAASGIGLGMSEYLLESGATVYLSDRDEAALKKLKTERPRSGARYIVLDVTDENAAEAAIRGCAEVEGRLDYLFNNAGIVKFAPFMETSLEEWKRILNINLLGAVSCTRVAAELMTIQGGGVIVNTASLASFLTQPFQSAYCASKFALLAMGESLRYELERFGISVLTVCPGDVATNLVKNSGTGNSPITADDETPVEEVVTEIMIGVAEKRTIIIVPEKMRASIRFDELHAVFSSDFMNKYYKKTAGDRWAWHDAAREKAR